MSNDPEPRSSVPKSPAKSAADKSAAEKSPTDNPSVEAPARQHGSTDPKLLELLVCPLTKTSLDYDAEHQELISRAARLAFPIRDGVPLMTAEAARHLDDERR